MPPIQGPMMVPMLQTKGITAKARAVVWPVSTCLKGEQTLPREERGNQLTFVFGLGNEFTNHCLNDTDIAVEKAAYAPTE